MKSGICIIFFIFQGLIFFNFYNFIPLFTTSLKTNFSSFYLIIFTKFFSNFFEILNIICKNNWIQYKCQYSLFLFIIYLLILQTKNAIFNTLFMILDNIITLYLNHLLFIVNGILFIDNIQNLVNLFLLNHFSKIMQFLFHKL